MTIHNKTPYTLDAGLLSVAELRALIEGRAAETDFCEDVDNAADLAAFADWEADDPSIIAAVTAEQENFAFGPTSVKAVDDEQRLDILKAALQNISNLIIRKVLKNPVSHDPILGSQTKIVSLGGRIQKCHGLELATALALILSFYGFEVMTKPKIALSKQFWNIAKKNGFKLMRELNLEPCGSDRRDYEADLIVRCPKTGWIAAFDLKRGNGASDANARNLLTRKLKTTFMTLPYWAAEKNLETHGRDVRVIDIYGQSGYEDEIAIRGWQLDDYFGCEVESLLAYFMACCRIAVARLFEAYGCEDDDAKAQPEDLAKKLWVEQPAGAFTPTDDLFATAEPGTHASIARFEDSRAASLMRFNARAAR